MTREPLSHTPAQDPGRVNMGSPDWWRRQFAVEPDWWRLMFSAPFRPTPDKEIKDNPNG